MRKSLQRNHHPIANPQLISLMRCHILRCLRLLSTSPPSELAEPETMWEKSCSRCQRVHIQGSFSLTHSMGCSKLTINPTANTLTVSNQRTGTLTISRQWAKTPLGSAITQKQMPPPSFAQIARSLRGDYSPHITIDALQELTTVQGFLAGTAMATMISTQMQQDAVTGVTFLDTVMASMRIVSLGATPTMVDCLMPALEELMELD